jgi:2-amino-4-hydroxy-6-hydroxymethyldihydropteridine diphosphokinase
MGIAYLLTGSNEGDRAGYLQSAATQLRQVAGKLLQCSDIYESASWGFEHPSPFLNQAIKLETILDPNELLEILLQIEARCGRTRTNDEGYEARTLDIDILFYDDLVIETQDLDIPHPRLHQRRFTLKPMVEIAPDYVHPLLKKSISQLLEECPDESVVMKYRVCRSCYRKEAGGAV